MSDSPKVQLEYIGPPNQDWNDGEKFITLVAGRRYPVEAALADYLAERNPTHWKRPENQKSAAKKEQ
jgi:hypothetical protein